MEAALSRTDGTLSSSCSVPFALAIRCGFDGWVECEGEGDGNGKASMSRSKMADEDECTEVGDDGMELGDLDPAGLRLFV